MNYTFTKSISIPAGTGSGMVIPGSSLCFWKTEGLWCLFLLFLPSLCVIQSSPGTRVTHTLQWARSEGETDDTLKEFNKRSTQSESVLRWGDKRVRWCWKGSYTFMMRLMGCLNPLSSNVHWRNTEYTEMTTNWPIFWHLVTLVPCVVQLICQSSPYTHTKCKINKYLWITVVVSFSISFDTVLHILGWL